MTNDQVKFIHSLLAEGKDRWVDAANAILYISQISGQVAHYSEAKIIVRAFLQRLLDNDDYLLAATLLWGNTMFNVEPSFVRRVFESLNTHSLILLQGAASSSKTYSAGAWMLLDWIRDPYFTTIKVISRDEGHLKTNLFAHIWSLLKASVIPITDDDEKNITYREHELFIGMTDAGPYFGFHGVAVKHSSSSTGDLKGFKPKPVRKTEHPRFGFMSRLRVLGDEGQNWPVGPFTDFESLKGSMKGKDMVKIVISYNPEDMGKLIVQMAEPMHGWIEDDLDKLYDWESKKGWHVTRLDGAMSENVIQKKEVYPGIQTYEGFLNYLKGDGADSSPAYFCVDTETTLLSKRGWIGHDEIKIGDIIYTVNPISGFCEWSPVTRIFNSEFNGNMVSMEGLGFSALVTKNHRWCLTNKGIIERNGLGNGLYFKETHELKNHDYIPLSRPCSDWPEESAWSDDFAELVGWVVTDGTFKSFGNIVCVNQSIKANASKCCRIRELLERLDANHTERIHGGIVFFNFSGQLAENIRKVVTPKKIVTMDFINSLSVSALGLLMESMLLGDGTIQGTNTHRFSTSNEEQAGVFSAICAKMGYSTNTYKAFIPANQFIINLGYKGKGVWMYFVNVRISKYTRIENMRVSDKKYTGIVWCPTTKNGTFLARRNGTTFLTGNCFCRGWPPIKGSANTIIPASWTVEARGEPVWLEKPVMGASVDLAFQGADTAQMTVFKWGLAKGWRKQDGKYEDYLNRTSVGNKKPRHVLEIHQIIQMEKSYDSIQMSEEITGRCKMLGILPEWVVVDKSGNGLGTFSHLTKYWGNVMGINWGDGATDLMVLAEDQEPASNRFQGISSEMWFAFREWLNPTVGAVVINPVVPTSPINVQLSSRRFRYAKNATMKVESKDEYKSRNQRSCDEADSVIQCVQLIRSRGQILPGMVEQTDLRDPNEDSESVKQETADIEDSICDNGNENDSLEL